MNLDKKINNIIACTPGLNKHVYSVVYDKTCRHIKKAILEEIEKIKLRKCNSSGHDERWCSACHNRSNAHDELKDDVCKLLES